MSWEISEDHKKIMSAFMTDFWKLIKASYEMPEDTDKEASDHYWATVVKWVDALSKKYNGDVTINCMLLGYLDGQSNKSNGFEVSITSNATA